jgi:3-hydroxyacyl-CoA dehydrogenase
MSSNKSIRRVAIIGTGVIGASWAALFLAKGLEVVATDIAPNAESAPKRFVEAAWPALKRLGLAAGASQSKLTFTVDLLAAVKGADLVQENGPERIDFKKKLYGQLDEASPADVIIASSSSGLTMGEIQSGCGAHPERCVIGHPFNPPHLMPLVEIVGGAKTSEDTIQRATEFYAGIGKRPVRLHKESPGHVANRLQAALSREVYYLVAEGVVSAADADAALSWGPGLHWCVNGRPAPQPPRWRRGRHRTFLPAVHRSDDSLVEGSRAAGVDARNAKEAHRQRPRRGRFALHRRSSGGARRIAARAHRAAHQA